jgi:hypothetical protein
MRGSGHAWEQAVSEVNFSKVILWVFNRVKFGAVARQEKAFHVLRNNQIIGHMPSGTVQDHEKELVQMPFGRGAIRSSSLNH